MQTYAPSKPSAETFIRTVNAYPEIKPEALADQLGLAFYEPFSLSQTHDLLIVEITPYGKYVFADGSAAGLSTIGGSYYAYLAESPDFKNIKRFVHPSTWGGRRRVPKSNDEQKAEPISRWAPMAPTEAFITQGRRKLQQV